jgi:ankyrin repeat protein
MFRSILPTRIVIMPFLLMILAGCTTPIQRAAKEGDLHTLRQLVDSGADPNEGAPLLYAVFSGKKESVI